MDRGAAARRLGVIAEHKWLNEGIIDYLRKDISVQSNNPHNKSRLVNEIKEGISDRIDNFCGNHATRGLGETHMHKRARTSEEMASLMQCWLNPKEYIQSMQTDCWDFDWLLSISEGIYSRSWLKSCIKDMFFEAYTCLPHYCVSAQNGSPLPADEALTHKRVNFMIGPYMYLSMGHIDYILFTAIAAELLRQEGIYAEVTLLGNIDNAPFSELIHQLLRLDYIFNKSIESLSGVDYIDYATFGDEKTFYAAAKIFERHNYASFMGFGEAMRESDLSRFECIVITKEYCESRLRVDSQKFSQHISIHVRTSEYKSDKHMDFRNGSLQQILECIPFGFVSEVLGLVGHYDKETTRYFDRFCHQRKWSPLRTENGRSDVHIVGGSKAFISTTSGPGHLACYLVPTLMLNATSIVPSLVNTDYATLSIRNIEYKRSPSKRGLSLQKIIFMLLGDKWSSLEFNEIFHHRPLSNSEVASEISEWIDSMNSGSCTMLKDINHSIFKELPQRNTKITMRTKQIIMGVIIRYS